MDLTAINKVLEEGGETAAEKLRTFFLTLQDEYRVTINLHDLAGISQVDPEIRTVLEPFLYHNNPFCNHVKKTGRAFAACCQNKTILCRFFRAKDKPFYGVCYLGIEELRYPIRWNGRLLGFLCVGQFCGDRDGADGKIDHYAKKFAMDAGEAKRIHRLATRPLDLDVRRFGQQTGFLADYLALLYARYILAKANGLDPENDAQEHTRHYLVTRTKSFIRANFASALSLELLAANAYCSPSYLSALFRRVEGKTLTDVILEVRLGRARTMLDTGSRSITDIAYACGFNDSNYFSRAFRKRYGESPREYRSGGFTSSDGAPNNDGVPR